MPMASRRCVALLLINSFLVPGAALADSLVHGAAAGLARSGSDVAGHLNSFAMIFGRCVWIPPSPKSALAAFSLFYGVDIRNEPDIADAEAVIIGQYSAAGKSQSEAAQEVAWLNACFATYEVPPEKRNHPVEAGLASQAPAAREADQ